MNGFQITQKFVIMRFPPFLCSIGLGIIIIFIVIVGKTIKHGKNQIKTLKIANIISKRKRFIVMHSYVIKYLYALLVR